MTKKEDESKSTDEHDMSARRARLRTSLNKQSLSSDLHKDKVSEPEEKSSMTEFAPEKGKRPSLSQAIESIGKNASNEKEVAHLETVALLSHIDQVMSSCAAHLASLQKTASKQIEELQVIAETLQSRAFSNEGQSLNPLMESLAAAIEPMKAIGELVPALDRLVNATESHDQLSGKSFQAAFQALQTEQSNRYSSNNIESGFINQEITSDEEIKKEFLLKEEEFSRKIAEKEQEIENIREQLGSQWTELTAQGEELKEALQGRDELLGDKEAELNKKISELSAKDSENQQLKAQIEELKDKTKEMMTDLQRQLSKKQEEEITRKQQEEIVKKQEEESVSKAAKPAAQGPQSGFFDFVSTGHANNTLFNTASPSLLPDETNSIENGETQNVEESAEADGWQPADIKPGRFGVSEISHGTAINNLPVKTPAPGKLTDDAQANSQASASFVSAVGSYGSGVRAQVFEVIVRQALAGTQWREICAVPMQSNNISPQEVEAEVKRRQALLKK